MSGLSVVSAGVGRWHVQIDGCRIPGLILGGNRLYVVEVGGAHAGRFRSLRAAAEFLGGLNHGA